MYLYALVIKNCSVIQKLTLKIKTIFKKLPRSDYSLYDFTPPPFKYTLVVTAISRIFIFFLILRTSIKIIIF